MQYFFIFSFLVPCLPSWSSKFSPQNCGFKYPSSSDIQSTSFLNSDRSPHTLTQPSGGTHLYISLVGRISCFRPVVSSYPTFVSVRTIRTAPLSSTNARPSFESIFATAAVSAIPFMTKCGVHVEGEGAASFTWRWGCWDANVTREHVQESRMIEDLCYKSKDIYIKKICVSCTELL